MFCKYGFEFTDAAMEAYDAENPNKISSNLCGWVRKFQALALAVREAEIREVCKIDANFTGVKMSPMGSKEDVVHSVVYSPGNPPRRECLKDEYFVKAMHLLGIKGVEPRWITV
jgi:hypothetical protein